MSIGKGTNRGGYHRKDLDKLIFRGDGGASAEKIKSDPRMAGTRMQMTKFGGWSAASKMFRDAIIDVSDLGHSMLSSDITRLCGSIGDLDQSSNQIDKPPIIFSRAYSLLEGYHLNKQVVFDAIISTPIGFNIERQHCKATVQLPQLSPGLNFRNFWNQPLFRVKINLGIIRDMTFNGATYKPITPDVQEHTVLAETDWLPSKEKHPPQAFELIYQEPVFDENCHLILAIGIEFGTLRRGGIAAVKDACCGKILRVA